MDPDFGPVESNRPSRKVLRRLEQIEALPPAQQAALLRTIEPFLEGAVARLRGSAAKETEYGQTESPSVA